MRWQTGLAWAIGLSPLLALAVWLSPFAVHRVATLLAVNAHISGQSPDSVARSLGADLSRAAEVDHISSFALERIVECGALTELLALDPPPIARDFRLFGRATALPGGCRGQPGWVYPVTLCGSAYCAYDETLWRPGRRHDITGEGHCMSETTDHRHLGFPYRLHRAVCFDEADRPYSVQIRLARERRQGLDAFLAAFDQTRDPDWPLVARRHWIALLDF